MVGSWIGVILWYPDCCNIFLINSPTFLNLLELSCSVINIAPIYERKTSPNTE
jgi:hypothetical protein